MSWQHLQRTSTTWRPSSGCPSRVGVGRGREKGREGVCFLHDHREAFLLPYPEWRAGGLGKAGLGQGRGKVSLPGREGREGGVARGCGRPVAERRGAASPACSSVRPGTAGAPAEGAVRPLWRPRGDSAPSCRRLGPPAGEGLPAWPTASSCLAHSPAVSPPVHAGPPAVCPLARSHAALRRSPRPASPALPTFSPRPAPVMLSFQYPDVYRDETSVSIPLSPRHPARAVHGSDPAAPARPAPLPGPLFAEPPRGRGAPPSAEPAGGRGPRAHARGQRHPAPRTDPRGSHGRLGPVGSQNGPCVSKGRSLWLKYGGSVKCMLGCVCVGNDVRFENKSKL